jgi:tetratricopeptide (TPR) repeat protein
VSQKHKRRHYPAPTSSAGELRLRIERARQEGRFQQALDLTKQLYKYESTPTHLDLLREVYLDRARQLRIQGQTRDALTVLEVASHLEAAAPEWLERLAEEMALCGEVGRTLSLLENMPDSPTKNRLFVRVADAALQRESAGRAALPTELHADFDRVLLAFQHIEAGREEAARETLQGIGLRSPFLEWKLLLRGLQAYWNNDDERAVENWQRLTADRLPARLAAPFRFRIDAAFRAAQPPTTQAALQKQIDRLQGSALVTQLRTLQATLADRNKMAAALRQAEALLPTLRQEAPQMVPRLAACFYWGILESGPDDVLRYQRVFGTPPDDPHMHRLQAIGYEKAEELELAHKHWQQYEQEIAAHPERWPGDQAQHARAFIWQHMGQNAASIPEPSKKQKGTPFNLFDEEPLAPLTPSAEKCFQKSLELAPDLLETHEALVRYHVEAKRDGKAEKAARQLLQQFPNHVPTLELLADLRRKHGDYAAALDLIQQAMKGNSVDRRLRRKVSDTHLLLARDHVEADRFDEARQQFQFALNLSNGPDGGMILAYWSACEFKADDDARAEELLQQALSRGVAPVGIAYLMLTEVLRLKLPRALKTRFDRDLKSGLATPSADGAVFLARILAGLHAGGVQYIGQKGHTQKVLSYIHKARNLAFTEAQLEQLCRNLLDMEAYPKARSFAEIGESQYPESPLFPYLHALGWIEQKSRRMSTWKVVMMLKRAQELAQAQPANERRDRMLEDIEKHLRELNPFDLNMIGRMFGFGGMPDIFEMGGEEDDDGGW